MRRHIHYRHRPLVSLILAFCLPLLASAQEAVVKGTVFDAGDRETLEGVNIMADSLGGTVTDESGRFEIKLDTGEHLLRFRYVGYADELISIQLSPDQVIEKQVYLKQKAFELNTAVVSASLYEQRLSDVTVSMEVIPARFIESVQTVNLDETISLMPGVDVMDGQANIRGGSGYSYGAGSRVMILLDELPLLTGDVNDVKWSALPVENIGQVEIVKGASSALYGSSALNGVINLHSATPGTEPESMVEFNLGAYMRPERDELSWWWDNNPFNGSLKFMHMQKAGQVDFSFGGSGLLDEGYRKENYQYYGRLNARVNYNPEKVKGLSFGIYTNFQAQGFSDFLIWKDADSGAYLQNPQAISPNRGIRLNVDPYARYFDHRQGRHSLRTRYYRISNHFPEDPDKENGSDYFYGEYNYQKEYRSGLHWTAGAAASYTLGNSELYGDHYGSTTALYSQLDYRLKDRLSLSLGLRWERYTIDDSDRDSRPVARAGLNYQAAANTFLRASFGQGYRYPSMAEKYTSTSLGSLKIFPNPLLMPETGWSAEIGAKQGYAFGTWTGYIDIAGYWTEYQDMIEFSFGIYAPDSIQIPTLEHLGFKSLNSGRARIAGIDITVAGQGDLGPVNIQFFTGYTYMDPLDLSADSSEQKILKYRYRHSAKGDLGATFKGFTTGVSVTYQSFIERIDPAFEETILGQEFFPGLKEYREENDKGAVVVDFRFGWQFTASSRISFIIRNLLNKEYMGRPGDIQPPRNISLQYLLKL